MLIVAQRPTATRVAGFHTWRRFNRAVRRGEKGIAILAPLVRRRRDEETADRQATPVDAEADTRDRAVLGWKTVYVFAQDQTDGAPLPSFPGRGTRGDVGPYLKQLCEAVQQDGIALTFHEDLGGAEGTCRPGHQDIRLRQGLDPAPAFCVLAHEYAHDLLHRRDDPARPADRRGREAEAEAVAAIVAEAVGLDHLGSAHDYIRLYDGNARRVARIAGPHPVRRHRDPDAPRPRDAAHPRARSRRGVNQGWARRDAERIRNGHAEGHAAVAYIGVLAAAREVQGAAGHARAAHQRH